MHYPFERWVAKALIPACLVVECATAVELPNTPVSPESGPSGATQVTIERCVERFAGDLEAIRGKADVSRTAADGPPPVMAALNDAFATDFERGAIARWMGIRNRCRRQLALARIESAPASAIGSASLQQATALSRMFESGVDHLIRALYYRELTYGEFVRKKYEFARDAADLGSAIDDAGNNADQARLGRTLRQLVYLKISWYSYLRRLHARQPGTVHNRGAIYT